MSNRKNSYNELIKWLEKYYAQKGETITTYRGLEYSDEFKKDIEAATSLGVEFSIDPMLPVDLIKVEEKKETNEETGEQKPYSYYQLFWVVLSDQPNLEKMMQFYQFYLSRVSEPYRVTTVMVLPFGCDNTLKEKLKKIAEENKFGLWQIDTSKKIPEKIDEEEIVEPKDFRDRMVEEFKNPKDEEILKELPEEVRVKPEATAKFFDTYVRDAIEAMVGITPEQVGKRYIERKVLDLVFELKNVSYRENLCELVSQHLSQKTNDYKFVAKAFSELWDICKFGIKYSDFLETFEPALYHIGAEEKRGYRDHYLHQFQVFLLGIHIIDKFRDKFPPQIEKQWLVASSFHDMAYPVQLYDSWSKKFFEKVLGISDVGASDLRSQFIDKTLLSCMGYLINSLLKTHRGETLQGNWLADEEKLVKFFYEEITMVKHHCIIGSVSLLKKAIGVKKTELLKDVFIPAALAVALHHENIWQKLKKDHKLSMIEFDKDPMSFLLLFCDCVQEWGRPTVSDKESRKKKEGVRKNEGVPIVSYLFSWDKIPGNDNGRLIEYLKQKFGIEWIKTAKNEKIDDGRTIRVFTEKNSLSLRLNDEKTKVNLKIDDGRADEFDAKIENSKLNIYIVSYKEEERFLLKEIKPSESKYSVTIWTPHLLSTDPFFKKKEAEVKELEEFLCQPSSIEFEIILEDKSGKEGRPYKMKGV